MFHVLNVKIKLKPVCWSVGRGGQRVILKLTVEFQLHMMTGTGLKVVLGE